MAKTPPLIFAWTFTLLAFCGGIILLGGMSASQRFCGRTQPNSNTAISAVAGYFAPTACDTFYQFSWYITWYQIIFSLVVAFILAKGSVHAWRYGVIGLLAPLFYFNMATANAFMFQANNLTEYVSVARAVLAGAIISSISDASLIMLFGVREEGLPPAE